jgi:hypothetical protein
MLKESQTNLQKNRNSSLGSLKLPRISSKFPKDFTYRKDNQNQNNDNKKTLEIKSQRPKAQTYKQLIYKTLKNDIDLVKNLDINLKVDQIFPNNFDSYKLKESIDNNNEIKLKRLGKFKQKQSRDEISNDIESKEKVKFLEKEFNNYLNEYNVIKNENDKINEHLSNLINIIDDYKLELYSLDNYKKEFFKQFLKIEEEKKSAIINKIDNNLYKDREEYEYLQKELKKFDYDKNMKFQNELIMRQENIKENINRNIELINDLKEQKKNLKEEGKELKTKINESKKKLIKLYHISLYEGLDFRYEGLSNVIRAIWNMGTDVDTNFMPSYLDKLLIDFLFNHAKHYLKIINLKKQIDISQDKYIQELNEWKTFNDYNSLKNENSSMSSHSDVNLFQTRLNNNKGKYPKSRKFMKNYYNKYWHLIDNKPINELNEYKKSIESNKNKISLPKKYIDEYNSISKGKYILQDLQMKMKEQEKEEIKRICREFLVNNYGNVYNVCPKIIVSAICGEENKEEGMMFFNKIEKEMTEKRRIIKFLSC